MSTSVGVAQGDVPNYTLGGDTRGFRALCALVRWEVSIYLQQNMGKLVPGWKKLDFSTLRVGGSRKTGCYDPPGVG